jgi:hypothetical protein
MTATEHPMASASSVTSFRGFCGTQLASHQQRRLLLSAQELCRRRHRGAERRGIAWVLIDDRTDRPRRFAESRGDIACDLDISRLAFAQRGADCMIDLVGRIDRRPIGHNGSGCRYCAGLGSGRGPFAFCGAVCCPANARATTGFMLSTIDVGIRMVAPRSLVVS